MSDESCPKCGRGPSYKEGCSVVDCPNRTPWRMGYWPNAFLQPKPVEYPNNIDRLFDPYDKE